MNAASSYRVTSTAGTGEEVIEAVSRQQPGLILMDIHMPGMGGLEATRMIKKKFPEIRILMLTTFTDNDYIWQALKFGADGYLLKDMETDRILHAISECLAGRLQMPASILPQLMLTANRINQTLEPRPDFSPLDATFTPREKETILLLLKGKTNQEIAEDLFLSTGTIKNRMSALFRKLNVRNRTEALVKLNEMIRTESH